MDRIVRYREIIAAVVADYAKLKPVNGEIEKELVVDPVRDHYVVFNVGWQGRRRVYSPVIHVDLIDGKAWIQHDGTDRPIADELLEAGIPHSDIVLAFHPADLRKHTGFAVG